MGKGEDNVPQPPDRGNKTRGDTGGSRTWWGGIFAGTLVADLVKMFSR